MRFPAGSSMSAELNAVRSTNTLSTAEFSVDKVVEGTYVAVTGRQVGSTRYAARLRIQADGQAKLYLLHDFRTLTTPALVPGVTFTANTKYKVKVRVSGTSPTTVSAKVWKSVDPEPASWHQSATDSDPALQQAGSVGVFGFLPSAASAQAPVTVAWHDLGVVDTTSDPVAPPTSPSPTAGSAAVGSTSYSVPAGAVFAVAGGGTGGTGTQASPYQSAQTAISKAPNGATVVLRGGVYRETVNVPFDKKLTIQSYPNEAVWFDGSVPVTGWVKSGSTWVVSNWNHIFDNRVSFGAGMDESSRYVDPAYPMAGHPDQVWVNGVELKQVGSVSSVTAGKFYVDRTNKRLVIGNDPTGKTVEASTRQKAIQIQGAGTTIRGIGIRRYAPHLAAYGAVSAEVNDLALENVVILDSATIGISVWGDRVALRNVTLKNNGLLGLQANTAPGLVVSRALVEANNKEHFKPAPASGGAKLTDSAGVKVVDSLFSRNLTNALWFDVSMRQVTVTGNRIVDNGEGGVLFEASGHAVIANNYIARNGDVGVWTFDSNDVQIWNNTLDRNNRSIQVLEHDRTQSDPALASSVPWVTSDIDIHNNVVVFGANFCPILSQHLSNKWTGAQFDIVSNGNAFHRTSASSPSRFACWANGSAGTKSFSDLAAFSSGTGNDKLSRLLEGTGILTSSGALTSTAASATASVPLGLPSDVASAVGRPAGEKAMGAYIVR